jgi:transformation/transcription domain-associated protein
MTDAPQTDAPQTDAPRQHLLPRPKSSPNQNQNSLSVSSSPTPTSSSSSTPSLSLRLAPTPSTIRRARVAGEQVSREHQSCYHLKNKTHIKIFLIFKLSSIRFQATSPLNFTLSSSDCRTLLKVLVSSLRHITWILADVKISENLVTQPKQFAPSITILYIKFFKYILQCLILFFDSTSLINSSTINNTNNLTRNKEEKEIMDMIASVFIVMHKQNYREIFENNLLFFYQCANKNPNITLIMNTLLQQSPSSTILVELLLEFLLPRINEIGETNNTNNACLKLFKLVINSVVTITLPNENEKILQPYLKQIILRSIECAQLTQDPYNYFILLRALFRSIGVGNHELLNQEFLTLLHFLLQRLNEYQSCKHRQHLRELFIELCLTVPVRLSVLLPYLPLLMEPLVNALNGSSTLILQGLRTLELCVDNLQPDFLYNHILPVRSSLMISLYRLLSHLNNDIAQNTFRILGKLGGNNRRILNEPQQIKYDDEYFQNEQQDEIYVEMFFENESKSINIPLLKVRNKICFFFIMIIVIRFFKLVLIN